MYKKYYMILNIVSSYQVNDSLQTDGCKYELKNNMALGPIWQMIFLS